MKLKKMTAYLIAFTMLIGLVFTTPVMAAITPLTGTYAEVGVFDIDFETDNGNDALVIKNGVIEEGELVFDFAKESSLRLVRGFNGKLKQHIFTFDLATELAYADDPFNATFLGLCLNAAGATPDGDIKGAWLGITQDKLILWFSHGNDNLKWGDADATENFKVVDLPEGIDSLASASYKFMYEGDDVEVYANDVLLATFGLDDDDKGVLTANGQTLTSVSFADKATDKYFALYNMVEEVEYDPTNPIPPILDSEDALEAPSAGLKVRVDNLKAVYYNDTLVTEAQLEAIEGYKADIEGALLAISEDSEIIIGETTYIKYGVDAEAMENILAAMEEIDSETTTQAEAQEIIDEWNRVKADFVSEDVALAFPGRFDGMQDALENADTTKYDEAKINKILADIETAKEFPEREEYFTLSDLDAEFNKIAKAFASLNMKTEVGVVEYKNSMKAALSSSEWSTEDGAFAVPSSEKGYGFFWTDNMRLVFNRKFAEPYSAKATLEINDPANLNSAFIGIRQKGNTELHMCAYNWDHAYGSKPFNALGTGGISIQSLYNADNYDTVRIVLKAGTTLITEDDKLLSVEFDVTPYIGEGATVATFILKDFGDLVEAYVVGTVDEYENVPVKFASIVIYPELGNVGTFTNCHTSGRIIDHLNDNQITEFLNMAIPRMADGQIAFTTRGVYVDDEVATIYIRDFEVATGLCPDSSLTDDDKALLAYFKTENGASIPSEINLQVGEGFAMVNETFKYDVVATDEEKNWITIAGHTEKVSGTAAITKADGLTVTPEYGDSILKMDNVNGTITGKVRGTDVVAVEFGGDVQRYLIDAKLYQEVEFGGYDVVAPSEEDMIEGSISEASIYNSKVFRSLNVGDEVIPVIGYAFNDGVTRILGAVDEETGEATKAYVTYEIDDETVVSYDAENGVFVANAEGTANIRAKVPYVSATGIEGFKYTPWIGVEVVTEGATYGVNEEAAYNSLIGTITEDMESGDASDKTIEEKKALLDEAIDMGADLTYASDEEAEILYAALLEAVAENEAADEEDKLSEIEVVERASDAAEAILTITEAVTKEDATADDLEDALFTTNGGVVDKLGLDETYVATYEGFGNTKSTNAMMSYMRLILAELEETGSLSATFLRESFEKAVKAQKKAAGGGGGGGGGSDDEIKITTDENTVPGGTMASIPSETLGVAKSEAFKLSEDEANVYAYRYSDVSDALWAKTAIAALTKNGIVDGYEDGTIRPNDTITRDEFVKLLVVAFGIDVDLSGANPYKDIPNGSWQIPYVTAATNAGIVNGIDTLVFGSGMNITRQDMATMIYKAAMKNKMKLPSDKIVSFDDAELIADYALESVNKLAAAGVISGIGDDTFAPAQVATRAQAFQMIYNIMLLTK